MERAQEARLVGRGEDRWTGYDVPDFPADKRPDYRRRRRRGMDAISGDDPFIMMADGRGWLYTPGGLLDGPMPTHYEPIESPVHNLLYPELGADPSAIRWRRPENPYHATGDPRYPLVATTFRLTEQHTTGGMSRTLPWLAELQPEMFAEIDPVLAARRGIEDGGWMTIVTERAEIEARALVTDRMRAVADRRPAGAPGGAPVALGLQRAQPRRLDQRPRRALGRPERLDPGVQGVHLRRARRTAAATVDRAPEGRRARRDRRSAPTRTTGPPSSPRR